MRERCSSSHTPKVFTIGAERCHRAARRCPRTDSGYPPRPCRATRGGSRRARPARRWNLEFRSACWRTTTASSCTTRSCSKAATLTMPSRWSGRPRRGSPTFAGAAASTAASTVPITGSFSTSFWITTCYREMDVCRRPIGTANRTRRLSPCAVSIRRLNRRSTIWSIGVSIGYVPSGPTALPAWWRFPSSPSTPTASACCCAERRDDDAPPDGALQTIRHSRPAERREWEPVSGHRQ